MKKLFKKYKIWLLRRKLKATYKAIQYGFTDYNCGHSMLLAVSSRYVYLCSRFNNLADKLEQLGEPVPKHRYNLKP